MNETNPTPTQQGETLEPWWAEFLTRWNRKYPTTPLYDTNSAKFYVRRAVRFILTDSIDVESTVVWPARAAVAGPRGDVRELGVDTNFPLSETLRLLVEWAQHLHVSHECDCDGWEQRSFLIEAAQGYQQEITAAAATSSPTGKHWCLKAGTEETMCGLKVHSLLATTLISDWATCEKCKVAAFGYQMGRADERAAAPADNDPESLLLTETPDIYEARRLLTLYCDTISQLSDQQAMPDNFYERTLEAVGRFLEPDAPTPTKGDR